MKDDEIEGLVKQTIAEAKANNKNEDMATKKDEAIERDAELKAVEEVLSHRILDRLTYGYGGPTYYPVNFDYARKVDALRAYHDYVLGWELNNSIAGLVRPSVDEVARVLGMVTGMKG